MSIRTGFARVRTGSALIMSKQERLQHLHDFLQSRREPVSKEALQAELDVSRATVTRLLAELRDLYHAPVEFDPAHKGYVLNPMQPGTSGRLTKHAPLPGIWFSPKEAMALLMVQRMLAGIAPGLLGHRIRPMETKLNALLAAGGFSATQVRERVQVLPGAVRTVATKEFDVVAFATLQRTRLRFAHYNRLTDQTLTREASPQRLVFYRDNWYLLAWCHLRQAPRSFSLDAVQHCESLDTAAHEVPPAEVDAFMARGFGIMTGANPQQAVLRFSKERSRWISREQWHPQEQRYPLPGERLELHVPYTDDRELLSQILSHGAHVEVVEPPALRDAVREVLAAAQAIYRQ
jgi:predicted DNA-binding transcriptional regulator YafY